MKIDTGGPQNLGGKYQILASSATLCARLGEMAAETPTQTPTLRLPQASSREGDPGWFSAGFESDAQLQRWLSDEAVHCVYEPPFGWPKAPARRHRRAVTVTPPRAVDWIQDAIENLPASMTVDEARAALRMSRRNFYRLTATGRIRARRAVERGSSRLLIPRAELVRYLKSP
jgi:excisionase family DNA binding protein